MFHFAISLITPTTSTGKCLCCCSLHSEHPLFYTICSVLLESVQHNTKSIAQLAVYHFCHTVLLCRLCARCSHRRHYHHQTSLAAYFVSILSYSQPFFSPEVGRCAGIKIKESVDRALHRPNAPHVFLQTIFVLDTCLYGTFQ